MSRENVEVARRMNEALQRGDMSTILELVDDDVIWCDREDDPGATVYHGPDGVRGHLLELSGDIAELRVDATEFIDRSDYVVMPVRVTGRGRVSDAPFQEDEVHVLKLRDGKVTEFREYRDRQEAFKALGLDE